MLCSLLFETDANVSHRGGSVWVGVVRLWWDDITCPVGTVSTSRRVIILCSLCAVHCSMLGGISSNGGPRVATTSRKKGILIIATTMKTWWGLGRCSYLVCVVVSNHLADASLTWHMRYSCLQSFCNYTAYTGRDRDWISEWRHQHMIGWQK